jgi:hypothetical protein
MHGSGISIWFFIGVSLLANGVLITGAGIWEWVHPPLNRVILFHLHANLRWGEPRHTIAEVNTFQIGSVARGIG